MDLNRLLSIIGSCIPVITVAGAVIVKEVLNVDPPETIYEFIMKSSPEIRGELIRMYTSCNDIADEIESYINEADHIIREYVNMALRGEHPNPSEFADRIKSTASRLIDIWPRFVDRYKPILPSGVFDEAFSIRLIDRIASTLRYIADLMSVEPNPFELDRTAHSLLRDLRARVRDGYVMCLRFARLIQPLY